MSKKRKWGSGKPKKLATNKPALIPNITQPANAPLPATPNEWTRHILKKTWIVVVSISTILGLLGLLTLPPSVEMHMQNLLESDEPFSSIVEIKNNSLFPITSVNYYMRNTKLVGSRANFIGGCFNPNLDDIPIIRSKESYSEHFRFERIFKVDDELRSMNYADFHFIVSYKYCFINCKDAFHFIGTKNHTTKKFVWTDQPLDESRLDTSGSARFTRMPRAPREILE